jgi:hypothetical protein
MSLSVLDMSVSVDGFIADVNDFLGGEDGERLHAWAESPDPSRPVKRFEDEWRAAGAKGCPSAWRQRRTTSPRGRRPRRDPDPPDPCPARRRSPPLRRPARAHRAGDPRGDRHPRGDPHPVPGPSLSGRPPGSETDPNRVRSGRNRPCRVRRGRLRALPPRPAIKHCGHSPPTSSLPLPDELPAPKSASGDTPRVGGTGDAASQGNPWLTLGCPVDSSAVEFMRPTTHDPRRRGSARAHAWMLRAPC